MTTAMTTALTVIPVPGYGPEDVVVDAEGWVYTGTDDGSVFRVQPDGARIDRVGGTGGRPLGLEIMPDGRLLVCDAKRGLLAMEPATGRIEVLTDLVHGRRMAFCNNAAVHSSGDIWFTDSARLYGIDQWRGVMVEDTTSGRLLRRSVDGSVEVAAEGLRFANGVAISADESYVVVAETGGRTVLRLWLTGPRAGERDRLATDLPGYPDNLSLGSDGLIWVAVASATLPMLERTLRAPRVVRRLAWRLPQVLQPKAHRSARVMAFDDEGRVAHDVSTDGADYHFVTGVREHGGRVWCGSLEEPAIAFLDLPA